jgi:hypothetical protein
MKLTSIATKQDGDSAFHAVFGKLDKNKVYVCDNVTAFREKIAQIIEKIAEDREIDAIQHIPLSIGAAIEKLKPTNKQEEVIALRKYAKRIGTPGNQLLPCELGGIAYARKVTIVRYIKDGNTDKFTVCEEHNPGQQCVAKVYINNKRHYQVIEKDVEAETALVFQGGEEYPASGSKKFLPGNIYQLKLLMLFLHRGYKNYEFSLATEMDAAGKFDDLVFEYKKPSDKTYEYHYIQAKHKRHDHKAISATNLLATTGKETDDNFSLQKYFISYQRMKAPFAFNDKKMGEFCILTNIGFGFKQTAKDKARFNLEEAFELEHEKPEDILRTTPSAVKYKFRQDRTFNGKEELYVILRQAFEMEKLANALAKYKPDEKIVKEGIIKHYYDWLVEHGIIGEEGGNEYKKLTSNFLSGKNLTEKAQELRKIGNKETVIEEPDKDRVINNFLRDLVFAVNQPNEVALGKIIADELGTRFNLVNNEWIYHKLHIATLDWFKHPKGTFLSQKDMETFFEGIEQEIARLTLFGQTSAYKAKLRSYEIAFKPFAKIPEFLKENQVIIYQVPGSALIGSIQADYTLQTIYKKDDSYIFMRLEDALQLKELKSAFVGSESKLLVLTCDSKIRESEVTMIQNLLTTLSSEEKILFITADSNLLEKIDLTNIKHTTSDAEINFQSLEEASQKWLQTRLISFQGEEKQLDALVSLDEIIDAEVLSELIVKQEIRLGEEPSKELSYYIGRTFHRVSRNIKNKRLKGKQTDFFVIRGQIDADGLSQIVGQENKVRLFSEEDIDPKQPSRYIIIDENNPSEQFQKICDLPLARSVHLLKWEENKFIWQKSQGSVANLRPYLVSENVRGLRGRYVILSAVPGMGKSTFISTLTQRLIKKKPELWIVKVNLLEVEDKLKGSKFTDVNDLISFFMLGETALAKKVFEYRLNHSGNLAIFLDGFDEIQASLQDNVIQLLKLLETTKVRKVVITTRPHLQGRLENALSLFSHDLVPFNEEDRYKFFKKFWQHALNLNPINKQKVEIYSNKLMNFFTHSIKDKQKEFIGIPLQAELLAIAFLKGFEKFHAQDGDELPQFPKEFRLYELYQRFIEVKYDIFLGKNVSLKEHAKLAIIKPSLLKSLDKQHQLLAFVSLFPSEAAKNALAKIDQSLVKEAGIVVKFIKGETNTPLFAHQTFAEYFAANFLVSGLTKPPIHPAHQRHKAILIRYIFKERNYVIRDFISELIDSSENLSLARAWKAVCNCNLLPNSERRFIISANNTDENLEELMDNWKTAKDWLTRWDTLYYEISISEETSYTTSFCEATLTITDIEKVTESLQILNKTIGANLFLYSHTIVDYLQRVFLHYIKICNDQKILFNKGLIQQFFYRKRDDNGQAYLQDSLFKTIDKLHDCMIREKTITIKCIKELINYLFQEKASNLLNILYFNLPLSQAKLTDIEIETIFSDYPKQDPDYFNSIPQQREWLKTAGITLVNTFKVLTPTISTMFTSIIKDPPLDLGCITSINYACATWDKLLVPLLDQANTKMIENDNDINKIALIDMCIKFMYFLYKYDKKFSFKLTEAGIQNLLSLLKNTLNEETDEKILSRGITQLYLLNRAGLQLIDISTSLLVVDPTTEFEYELQLKHKNIVQKLLVFKGKDPENEKGLLHQCKQAIQQTRKDRDNAKFISVLEILKNTVKRTTPNSNPNKTDFPSAKRAKIDTNYARNEDQYPQAISPVGKDNAGFNRGVKRPTPDANSKKIVPPPAKKAKTEVVDSTLAEVSEKREEL